MSKYLNFGRKKGKTGRNYSLKLLQLSRRKGLRTGKWGIEKGGLTNLSERKKKTSTWEKKYKQSERQKTNCGKCKIHDKESLSSKCKQHLKFKNKIQIT